MPEQTEHRPLSNQGLLWLASRPSDVLLWQQSGSQIALELAGLWRAELVKNPEGKLIPEEIEHLKTQLATGHPVFGDRHNELTPQVFDSLGQQQGVLLFVKFVLALAVLFPPAFFMGGTLPMISVLVTRGLPPEKLGQRVPLFYGINTLGAALGALTAGFFLPRWIGVANSYWLAIGITTFVGLLAIVTGRKPPRENEVPSHSVPEERTRLAIPRPVLWLAFFSGFTTLALEVLWTRMFAQTLQNSVYSYTVILFTFLVALALGSWIAGRLASHFKGHSPRILVRTLLVAGLLTLASPTLFHHFGSDQGGLLGSSENWSDYLRLVFVAAGITIFPATVALGVVFPFLLHLSDSSNPGDHGRIVGRLAGLNTLGAVLGSVAAGFVLLELFGLWPSIRLLAVSYLLLVFAFSTWQIPGASGVREKFPIESILAAVGLMIGLTWIDPAKLPKVYFSAINRKESVLEVREGSDATVAVIRRGDTLRMKVNNFYVLGSSGSSANERFQCHLPLIIHPKPERVFCLGLGTGITAGGVLEIDGVKKLTVAELSQGVVDMARDYFSPWVNGLFTDERVSVVAEDGRNYLAATRQTYDVIIADLFLPWRSGVGSLYTVDHYSRSAARLEKGGIYAQWLPLYQLTERELASIANSMRQVFPLVTVWRGDFFPEKSIICLVGHLDDSPLRWDPFEDRSIELNRMLNINQVAPFKDLAGHLKFYGGNLTESGLFSDGKLNTDNFPHIEYLAPITHRAEKAGEVSWIPGQRLLSLFDELEKAAPFSNDPWLSTVPESSLGMVRVGHLLHELNLAKKEEDRAAVMATTSELKSLTQELEARQDR